MTYTLACSSDTWTFETIECAIAFAAHHGICQYYFLYRGDEQIAILPKRLLIETSEQRRERLRELLFNLAKESYRASDYTQAATLINCRATIGV